MSRPIPWRFFDSFTAFFLAFPHNYTRAHFRDGERAFIEWRGGGTMRGAFAGHAPTGRSFTLRGCGFFHIVDGRIRFQRVIGTKPDGSCSLDCRLIEMQNIALGKARRTNDGKAKPACTHTGPMRSEERRVGKEWRSRWWTEQ